MQIGVLWLNWTFLTFIVTLGYDNLSLNKIATQNNIASNCLSCVAQNAVDGNMNTCTRTDEIGTTSGAYQHTTWWYVDLGDVFNLYNIRIQFKDYGAEWTIRQRGRFAGFSLYVSNTTDRQTGHLCYHNTETLPPLDFSIHCISRGHFVIFYNERLSGNYPDGSQTAAVYTELCEVTVIGCERPGVYGNNCDKLCTDNCLEPRCNISNGACFSCPPGWIGDYCKQVCPSGYYGVKCMTKCEGHCYENKPCNHTTGLCSNGCLDGWTGVKCNKPCLPGKYGPECLNSCTGHCFNNAACNITTGKCDVGCEPEYTGDRCDKKCLTGKYGDGCLHNCIGYCLNDETCNITTGKCDSGCKIGYKGDICDKECSSGTYGHGCLNNCSGHCLNDAPCNRKTGNCDQGCRSGYIGNLCEKAITHVDRFNENCKESFYIAGLSVFILIIIVLIAILLLFVRRYRKLVREMRTSQYATMTTASQQPGTDTKDEHQYQELRI